MSGPKRPGPWRRRLLLAGWLVAAVAICARAAQIQVVQAPEWRALALEQHRTDRVTPAARGAIMDRDGTPLAVSRERIRVSVAPRELDDRTHAIELLAATLGISNGRATELTDPRHVWRQGPGLYPPTVREALGGVPGIHVEPVLQRFRPYGALANGVLGVILEDEGQGGIEEAFDGQLKGTPGREVVARDSRGGELPGERLVVSPPLPGGQVVLTLNMDLQEIAQQTLMDAIEEHDAHGGDILITNPMTGEVLALFSMQGGTASALSAINTPFEPGSTLKPFTVAGLLEHDLAAMNDVVDGENGSWEAPGRTLTDITPHDEMTVGEALRVSSNIGIAKAALPMEPGLQYETLRDFGFGTMTGIEIPGESAGRLRRPDAWTVQSAASLAIGYEVSVTPLQMAMAYGALANGGRLMQPMLVRELRDAEGRVVERFEPVEVRQVVSERVAETVGSALVDVVQDGTGTSARLGSFLVAGKSGTARFTEGGRYVSGAYSSSFAGYFPADKPQLVIFVKLDRPRGDDYYGGAVAGPVTRTTMEAALAASATPLDLGALVTATRNEPRDVPAELTATFASLPLDPPLPPFLGEAGSEASAADGVALPDVSGLPARVAARRLHALGLRVERIGLGDVNATVPAAGQRVAVGDTIRLSYTGRTFE